MDSRSLSFWLLSPHCHLGWLAAAGLCASEARRSTSRLLLEPAADMSGGTVKGLAVGGG